VRVAILVLLAAAFAASAAAQPRHQPRRPPPRPAPHAGSWEVGGGVVWVGGFEFGEAQANETRNPTTGTGPLTLFVSDNSVSAGFGFQGRLGYYLTSHLEIEGGLRYTRPKFESALSADFESAPSVSANETLDQYVVDGSVVFHFMNGASSRAVPFVSGGVGYLRDVHDGNQLIETGTEFHVTGGVKWWLGRPAPKRLGIRAEGGVSIMDGGFTFDDKRRTEPVAGAALIYVF
jgi:outer membrane protein with beta-barrel domain